MFLVINFIQKPFLNISSFNNIFNLRNLELVYLNL